MKKGTHVSWKLRNGASGTGTVITDEADGKVQVAVETQTNEDGDTTTRHEMHYVIWCNVTWLTPIDTAA